MTTAYMGIDPGKTGAIAVIHMGNIKLYPVPMIGSTGKKSDYDVGAMADIIRHWSVTDDCFCMLEKASVFKGQGISSSGNFMMGFGIWRGILGALRIPHEIVTPRKWTKAMHEGLNLKNDPKRNSEIAAKRLFPDIDFRKSDRASKPYSGFIDALLLAEYGRRKLNRP